MDEIILRYTLLLQKKSQLQGSKDCRKLKCKAIIIKFPIKLNFM